jgi:hypothetical protein
MNMRNPILVAAGFAMALAAPVAQAADTPPDAAVSAPEALIEQALRAAALEPQLLMVVGNQTPWGGDPALLAGEWLGLACASDCTLRPARVEVGPAGDGTGGLPVLAFTLEGGDATSVRAWLAVDPQRAWLRAGPVVQYAFGARGDTPGSFELAVDTQAAGGSQLVPLLDGLPQEAPPQEEAPPVFYLQLRESGRRQLLPGHLAVFADASLADYLHWAGDLDRDGRADYFVRFGDGGGEMHLYLSGEAADGSLVALAGRASANASEAPGSDD